MPNRLLKECLQGPWFRILITDARAPFLLASRPGFLWSQIIERNAAMSKSHLTALLTEIRNQLGEVSVATINLAHSLYPNRYPSYGTFQRVLGGITTFQVVCESLGGR